VHGQGVKGAASSGKADSKGPQPIQILVCQLEKQSQQQSLMKTAAVACLKKSLGVSSLGRYCKEGGGVFGHVCAHNMSGIAYQEESRRS
jgi:hypothetical protein